MLINVSSQSLRRLDLEDNLFCGNIHQITKELGVCKDLEFLSLKGINFQSEMK